MPISPLCQYGWIANRFLYHSFHNDADIGDYLPKDQSFVRFVFFSWMVELETILAWLEGACTRRPQDSFHFLCCDELLAKRLQARGISSHHISHNAFLDERLYEPAAPTDDERKYDAVYVARMSHFKRHALAVNIPRLLLLGNVVCEYDDAAYAADLQRKMPAATFTLDEQWLQTPEVARRMGQAHVGLILSETEGGSYVTAEYQLCGLPVVTTPSRGGRETWLHPHYSRVVAANPTAIADAVADLKQANLDPLAIRSRVVALIAEQRQRLFILGQSIYEAQQIPRDFSRDFYASFTHRIAKWRPMHEVAGDIAG